MVDGELSPGSTTEERPAFAEPFPEWRPALQTWKWAWGLHWIGFGMLFTALALYSLLSLIQIAKIKSKKKRGHLAMAITSLLLILGATRALFLFINPYESKQCNLFPRCPVMLSRILFGIALPCITASFSLVHLAFLQVTKLKLYPEKLQSTKFLSCLISLHFGLAIITEVMLSVFADMKTLSIVCQSFFIVFNLTLSVSFMYSGTKIVTYVTRNHTHVSRLGQKSMRSRNCSDANKRQYSSSQCYRPNVSKLVKITYITVLLGFASCALQLYSIFHVHKMYKEEKMAPPEPWPWLIFQSLYRLVELATGCTLAYVSSRQASRKIHLLMRYFVCCRQERDRSGSQETGYSSDARGSQNTDDKRESAA